MIETPPLPLDDAGLRRSCLRPLLLDKKLMLLPLLRPTRRTVMIETPPLPLDDAGLRRSCLRPLLLDKKLMLLPLLRPTRRTVTTTLILSNKSAIQRTAENPIAAARAAKTSTPLS